MGDIREMSGNLSFCLCIVVEYSSQCFCVSFWSFFIVTGISLALSLFVISLSLSLSLFSLISLSLFLPLARSFPLLLIVSFHRPTPHAILFVMAIFAIERKLPSRNFDAGRREYFHSVFMAL